MSGDSPVIPADPLSEFRRHQEEIEEAVLRVLRSGRYLLGPETLGFEKEFADWVGTTHCVATASGTGALELILRGLGVGAGDLVIAPSFTAGPTIAAIRLVGAVPLFADVAPDTFCLCPDSAESALSGPSGGRVRAVIAVHLYGHPADMERLGAIADSYGVPLIEDCAQAHGAVLRGRRAGSLGTAAAFSFYPTKNLAALGDAGAVTTADTALAERLRMLREYGWRRRQVSEAVGMNCRMDEIQAAVLRTRLRWVDAANERRREIAGHYRRQLGGLPIILPSERPGCRHVFHQFNLRCARRDALQQWLGEQGVTAQVLYPVPAHLQPAYAGGHLSAPGGLPYTESLSAEILCLPVHPALTDAQVSRVSAAVREWTQLGES